MSISEAFKWVLVGGFAITLMYLLALLGAEVYKSVAWKIRMARLYLKEGSHE